MRKRRCYTPQCGRAAAASDCGEAAAGCTGKQGGKAAAKLISLPAWHRYGNGGSLSTQTISARALDKTPASSLLKLALRSIFVHGLQDRHENPRVHRVAPVRILVSLWRLLLNLACGSKSGSPARRSPCKNPNPLRGVSQDLLNLRGLPQNQPWAGFEEPLSNSEGLQKTYQMIMVLARSPPTCICQHMLCRFHELGHLLLEAAVLYDDLLEGVGIEPRT